MMSNMSTDVSFLRVNQSALSGLHKKDDEEVSALCVEEAADQKPLALESVTPDSKFHTYKYCNLFIFHALFLVFHISRYS